MFTLALVTDIHFGPEARFAGKLRKLSQSAPELTAAVVRQLGAMATPPNLVVNLGDVIEDESPHVDKQRYQRCLELLGQAPGRLLSVAGNHDCINLSASDLRQLWGLSAKGPLHYSCRAGGYHFVVLHTHERKDVDVRLDEEQFSWLEAELNGSGEPCVLFMHHSAAEQELTGNRWFSHAPQLCLLPPAQRQRLRAIVAASGRVRAVFNGHLHWNQLNVIDGVPYVTLQSLSENIDEDEPGRAASSFAVARISSRRLAIEVYGRQPARYQFDWTRAG